MEIELVVGKRIGRAMEQQHVIENVNPNTTSRIKLAIGTSHLQYKKYGSQHHASASNRTVPVSCFETPTRADKIFQQLSHSTQGSGSHSSANEASLIRENAYPNTAARIQQHIGSRVATPTTVGKDYPATCRTSQGHKINNTRRVNLLNRHTPANTTTQTSPDTEITVPVPELDKIGVRRTVWYSDEASHGPRNLLNSFNKVGENSGSGRTDTGLSEDCHGREFESTSTNNNGFCIACW
ncbi:hypothetical protein ACET3Z_018339 [Daucus carota]